MQGTSTRVSDKLTVCLYILCSSLSMASVPRVRTCRRTSETHHNIINMEFIKEENEEMGVKDEETEEKIGWFLFSLHRFYTEKMYNII